jgi:SAM-dependent methyltransferase
VQAKQGLVMMQAKAKLKQFVPVSLRCMYARMRSRSIQRHYRKLSLATTFDEIYASGAWSGDLEDSNPQSGSGSLGRHVTEYCALLDGLLRSHNIASVADLGCGDFAVGRQVCGIVPCYAGVDIAESVIAWNKRVHAGERASFIHADITRDELPDADVALVRQVFQHLTNSEIQAALRNILRTYRLAVVTEHVYTGPQCTPNIDMPHGPGTRVTMRSGVFLDRPPYSLRARVLGDIVHARYEVLRTWVVDGTES